MIAKIDMGQTPEIYNCQAALFEWAESFDTKDWTRLAGCVAPTLYVRLHFFFLFFPSLWYLVYMQSYYPNRASRSTTPP